MPPTGIEWTDRAWPVVNGCRRVSPGCEHCWAERLTATRLRNHPRYKGLAVYTEHGPRWTGERRMALDILDEPLRVKKPQRWFVANKGDLFGEGVSNEEIAAVFGVMSAAAHHTFQVLTKRPERMVEWFAWASAEGTPWERVTYHGAKAIGSPVGYGMGHRDWPLSNVWIGVSVEDQQRADERIPHLLRVPAAVRFLSMEPLLGPVTLKTQWRNGVPFCGPLCDDHGAPTGIGWVIVGSESGHGARPMDEAWVRSLRDQCVAVGVPFFYKQRLDGGRKVSLPLLDGQQSAEFPR